MFRVVFFLIFFMLDAWWAVWADRRLRRWKLLRGLSAVYVLVQVAAVLAMVIWPHAVRSSDGIMPVPLIAAVYIWHLLIVPIWFLLTMVVRLVLWIGSKLPGPAKTVSSSAPSGVTRRQFVGAAAVALPVVTTGVGALVGAGQVGNFRIRRMTLNLRDLPGGLDGLTIAHVSDIHIGAYMPPERLPAVVDAVNALGADLVLHTGDLIDYAVTETGAGLEAIQAMKANYGAAMCVGNHDLFDDPTAFMTQALASSIPMLYDDSMVIPVRGEKVQIMGIRWSRSQSDLVAAVGHVARRRLSDAFPILMAHHPHAFDPAIAAGLPLTLSGHTHGGQLMLTPTIGAGPMMFRYWSGLYTRGTSQLVVSNGVGNWFPLRINAPAEIIHLTLRKGA